MSCSNGIQLEDTTLYRKAKTICEIAEKATIFHINKMFMEEMKQITGNEGNSTQNQQIEGHRPSIHFNKELCTTVEVSPTCGVEEEETKCYTLESTANNDLRAVSNKRDSVCSLKSFGDSLKRKMKEFLDDEWMGECIDMEKTLNLFEGKELRNVDEVEKEYCNFDEATENEEGHEFQGVYGTVDVVKGNPFELDCIDEQRKEGTSVEEKELGEGDCENQMEAEAAAEDDFSAYSPAVYVDTTYDVDVENESSLNTSVEMNDESIGDQQECREDEKIENMSRVANVPYSNENAVTTPHTNNLDITESKELQEQSISGKGFEVFTTPIQNANTSHLECGSDSSESLDRVLPQGDDLSSEELEVCGETEAIGTSNEQNEKRGRKKRDGRYAATLVRRKLPERAHNPPRRLEYTPKRARHNSSLSNKLNHPKKSNFLKEFQNKRFVAFSSPAVRRVVQTLAERIIQERAADKKRPPPPPTTEIEAKHQKTYTTNECDTSNDITSNTFAKLQNFKTSNEPIPTTSSAVQSSCENVDADNSNTTVMATELFQRRIVFSDTLLSLMQHPPNQSVSELDVWKWITKLCYSNRFSKDSTGKWHIKGGALSKVFGDNAKVPPSCEKMIWMLKSVGHATQITNH